MSFWRILVSMNISFWYLNQWRLIRYWYPQIATCLDFNSPDKWHREIDRIIHNEFIKLDKGHLPEIGFWEAIIHLVLIKQAWIRSEFQLTLDIATRMQDVLDQRPTVFSGWLAPHAKAWQSIGAVMTASQMEPGNERKKLETLALFWANTAVQMDKTSHNKWFAPDKLLLSTTILQAMPNCDTAFWKEIQDKSLQSSKPL
jgi:hypothetical protein